MWLKFRTRHKVLFTSVDVCKHRATVPAAQTVQARYGGDRFKFYASDSKEAKPLLQGKSFDIWL